MAQKKPGLLRRLFSSNLLIKTKPKENNDDDDDDDKDDSVDEEMLRRYKQRVSRRHTVSTTTRLHHSLKTDQQLMAEALKNAQLTIANEDLYGRPPPEPNRVRKSFSAQTSRIDTPAAADTPGVGGSNLKNIPAVASSAAVAEGLLKTDSTESGGARMRKISTARRVAPQAKSHRSTTVDVTKPLEFPATPETILEYHKQRPILDSNEEWLLVELNQFECLVDSLDVIRIIAKHSMFFEVGPGELWEEFFGFVDDVPSYDEVINFDVWQEFRDKKYTC